MLTSLSPASLMRFHSLPRKPASFVNTRSCSLLGSPFTFHFTTLPLGVPRSADCTTCYWVEIWLQKYSDRDIIQLRCSQKQSFKGSFRLDHGQKSDPYLWWPVSLPCTFPLMICTRSTLKASEPCVLKRKAGSNLSHLLLKSKQNLAGHTV